MRQVPAEEVRSGVQVHGGGGGEAGGEEGEEEGEEEEEEGEEEEGMDAEEYAEGGEGLGHEDEGEHPPQVVWRRPTGRGPVGKEWDTSIGERTTAAAAAAAAVAKGPI